MKPKNSGNEHNNEKSARPDVKMIVLDGCEHLYTGVLCQRFIEPQPFIQ